MLYTRSMALTTGQSPQDILNAIAGKSGLSEQVVLNQAGGYSDYLHSPQEVVNLKAGRTATALSYQAALAANLGYSGLSVEDMLLKAYKGSVTMSKIISGS